MSREISKSRICFFERFFAQMENLTEVGAQKPSLFTNDVVSMEKIGIELFLYSQGVVNTIGNCLLKENPASGELSCSKEKSS